MPVHLPVTNRRRFLQTAAAALLIRCEPSPASQADPNLVWILNDTHIGEKQPGDSPVPSHLRQAIRHVLNSTHRPAAVLINGDLALKDGQPGDYRHFARLIKPLHDAKIPVHLTLGNHDHRETFFDVLKDEFRNKTQPVASKHISVVETPLANFFLLDSLHETMTTPGTLGPQQLAWLARTLDRFHSKPAVIVAHHNPRLGGDPLHFPGGLTDSQPLWEVLAPRRHVKAYVHGHIHDRGFARHQQIHILNTPATSYVADPAKSTTGFTMARFSAAGVALTTVTTDRSHTWNGQITTLTWRSN